MNRWDVFEWLKDAFMYSGKLPTCESLLVKFDGKISPEELFAGVHEFSVRVTMKSYATDLNSRERVRRLRRGA